ncbi:hypothetical protein G9A89_021840 [Geosiphon pyriformis]|nr:hypothetical protein G9A89_021840 [Geosiphon pyriformis]
MLAAEGMAKDAAFSVWCLPYLINECFLSANGTAVSGNSRHFVHDVFRGIHRHPDSYLAASFTTVQMAGYRSYFMKAFYWRLSVAICKCLYDKSYFSIACLFCGDVEVSDHVFSCSHDTTSHA